MSLENMMFHSVDWYRCELGKDRSAAEYVRDKTAVATGIPVNIQPATASEVNYYNLKGEEVSHTIYTATVDDYRRNDRLFYGAREFIVTGVRNLIELGRVIVIDALEYPSVAKGR